MKIALIILLTISGLYLVLMTIMTIIHRPRRSGTTGKCHPEPDFRYPPVSILKPIRGVEDDLEANIESFYRLDYPVYEILFAFDDWEDKAIEIIRKVSENYPRIRTKILAPGHNPTENPKIHKLDFMEKQSYGRLLWVADANVRVEAGTLRCLVDEYLTKGARLIFSPIMGTSSRTFASLMENTSLNFFTSGNVITLWKLFSIPVVMGKSMLIDRLALKTFGGFKYFQDYLAEDYLIGKSFQESGFKISTNFTWVANISQQASFKSFYRRMARWARLRYLLNRPAYVSEILLNPVILSLSALAVSAGRFWELLLLVAAGKILLEYLNFLAVNMPDRSRLINHLLFPLMVVVKDVIFFVAYLTPFFNTSVDWRGGRIRVGRNSLIYHPARYDKLVYEEV
ncbi:MAG: glycosyltransferase [Candidatus Saccharicenans sp.]|jgi:ceramide glucosyltransferase|nr:glycosyltransferase [Candidatus Saccharicenans sp.]MDH7574734.1 glycosyltransferase [Candidatus Saccharicenans sp.]